MAKNKRKDENIVPHKSNKTLKNVLVSIFCLALGILIGVFGSIFVSLPDSYKIPKKVQGSNSSSLDVSSGLIDESQIKASDVGSAPLLFTEFQKHYGIIDTNIIHRQISKRNWKLVKVKVEVIE